MCALAWCLAAPGDDGPYDVLIRGGRIVDGSCGPAFLADVAIRDGRIVAVGPLPHASAARIIDAAGRCVAPGFIDIHSHADDAARPGGLRSASPAKRAAPNLVAQGVTTVVVNQDGRSLLDIELQREALEEGGTGVHVALLAGHNTIRRHVMGADHKRAASAEELEAMAALVRESLAEGAWGLSAGLEYGPGIWSTTEELIGLAKEIVPYGGPFIIHERSSGLEPMWYTPSQGGPDPTTLLDYADELAAIAEGSGATIVATHIKARGVSAWGSGKEMIARIEAARDRGLRIYADQYPYTSSGSDGHVTLIPSWLWDDRDSGGIDYAARLHAALNESLIAGAVRQDIAHQIMRRGGPDRIFVMEYPKEAYVGRSLEDIARERGIDPVEMAIALQLEGTTGRAGGARLRGFSMTQSDVEAFMIRPWVATASDAGIAVPDGVPVHARHYGTFPRKIGKYAVKRGLLPLEAAVRSATGLPAEIMGFTDRGFVRAGMAADLVVFDPESIRDTATFTEPHQYPEGIDFVMVAGEFVVDGGARTGALPGTVLLSKRKDGEPK